MGGNEVLSRTDGRGAAWRVRLAGEADAARYDAFVRKSARGHPLQLWSWGEVKRADGWEPLRIIVERDGEIAAGLGLVERAPVRTSALRLWIGHRGPVAEPGTPALQCLWLALRRLAQTRGVFAARLDPEWPEGEGGLLAAGGLRPLAPRMDWYLGAMQPLRSWRIRLDGGLDAVFNRFEPHTRYDVRRSGRKGIAVRDGRRQDLPAFHALERAAGLRRGFPVRSAEFFGRLWTAWQSDGSGRLFIADHQGRCVGGAWFVRCGRGCWGQFAADDPAYRRLLPSVAVYWAGIQWAVRHGCRFCDFGGIDHRDGVADGLRAFKKGFGPGDLRFVAPHDLVFRPAAYRVFRMAEESRWALARRARRTAAPTAAGSVG